MLNFLRKYQKIVFGVVTAALIVSISFFGSYNALTQNNQAKEKDFVIGSAVDGSSVSHLEIEKLSRFIASDCMDLEAYEYGRFPNYFNDGIIRKDFFESGIAAMLIQQYFDDLEKDLQQRLDKQKQFKPYSHPDAPFLSAETVWNQFQPSLAQNISKIQKEDFKLSKDNVDTLISIYLESSKFPSYLLRRFLSYQQNQYQWIKKDYYLESGDLSLFYFHNFEDWFGKTFLNLLSQVIHNASIYAKSKGYKVSYEEARADLLRNGYEALKAQKQEGEVSSEVLLKHWKEQLQVLGLKEVDAIAAWEKVLLSRKLLDDYGNSIFLDRLNYENFHEYASENVDADVYSLPKELRFKNFHSLMLFETYKDLTTQNHSKNLTSFSGEVKSLDDIKKSAPELLYKTYEIDYATVSKNQAATLIGIQEMWDWQLKDDNWKKLRLKFPEVAKSDDKTPEAKAAILDKLSEQLREAVDNYSREVMLEDSHQELIGKALDQAETQSKNITIDLAGHKSVLKGVKDSKALMKLFDEAALKDGETVSEQALASRKILENYTQDKENFYRIYLLKKDETPRLFAFHEALKEGVLEPLLDKKLKASMKLAKEQNPEEFKDSNGSEKDFASTKEVIGKTVFKDLIKNIEKDYEMVYGKKHEAHPLEFYAKNRFLYVMNEKLKEAKNSTLNQTVFSNYCIEKQHKTIFRKEAEDYVDSHTFSMNEGEYSDLKVNKDGNIIFYNITKKAENNLDKIAADVMAGQSLLVEDAKRHLMSEFLEKLKNTDSIHLDKLKPVKEKKA